MRKARHIDAVYTQTEGEATCFILGGVWFPPGLDVVGKRRYAETHYHGIRNAIMREPRGHNDLYGAIVAPAHDEGGHAAPLWMDGEGFADMCGHGTIALATVLTASGVVKSSDDPVTKVHIETVAGPIVAEVHSSGDEVDWCRFQNVPAYLAARDILVELPEIGTLRVDIAFGGVFFALVEWTRNEPKIGPDNASYFGRLGTLVKQAINAKFRAEHPVNKQLCGLDMVTFYHEAGRPDALYRCVHTYRNGKTDRSPGGTGTSAMMAMLEGRG
ncbi:MAG: proline racemase family protein [Pseudorhodoplanes sp.]